MCSYILCTVIQSGHKHSCAIDSALSDVLLFGTAIPADQPDIS